MAWPGLGKCTAYPRPSQDSLPLGVRWFSDGLGGAGGRGWEEHGATVRATGLRSENKKRESARLTVGEQVAEPAGSRTATEGDRGKLPVAKKRDCGIGSLPAVSGADKLKRCPLATEAVWLTPNVELTGPLRRDGLARVGKMYRVPQAGPRQPAVVGPVVQRWG